MRELPEGLRLHLERRTTSLARAWRLTRRDGAVLGFTDHDEPLAFAGAVFEASTGLTAGEAEAELGLAAGTQGVEGALSALSIREEDLAAGRYDGARVEIFLVNWQAPEERLLLDVCDLGEVKRGAGAFAAELRGLATRLDRQRGRIYRRRCDAALGDARCKVAIEAPHLVREATVLREENGALDASGLADLDAGIFSRGHVEMLDGSGAGLAGEIAALGSGAGAGETRIHLIRPIEAPVAAGDRFRIRAGCDKSFETCREKFGNHLNFRGFPHLPGADAALSVAKSDGLHDGGPVVP